MTILQPLETDKASSKTFEDISGGNEPVFTRCSLCDGTIVYVHQSGYGYLSEDKVCIESKT